MYPPRADEVLKGRVRRVRKQEDERHKGSGSLIEQSSSQLRCRKRGIDVATRPWALIETNAQTAIVASRQVEKKG